MRIAAQAASNLIEGANIFAIGSYQGFTNAFPEFEVDLPAAPDSMTAWDFFVTVAAVGVAYDAIALSFQMPESNAYRRAVPKALSEWDAASDEAFEFFLGATRDIRPRFDKYYAQAVGVFVLWRIYSAVTRSKPTAAQLRPSGVLGKYIVNEFVEWWPQ
jgi:hypothetical protein